MRSESVVISRLQQWAYENESVRAVVLTGSRANPGSIPDVLSDYDIDVYVNDIGLFLDDDWLLFWGNPLIKWPLQPETTFSEDWITRLVIFDDYVRIDFQITANTRVDADRYDNGLKILADKDGLTDTLDEPSYTKFFVTKPSEREYVELVNSFFWNTHYIAKHLCRNELYFARYMMDSFVRYEHLHTILEWYSGMRHDWRINTGTKGRYFNRILDESTWQDIEHTFADADIENNWQALFTMITLFGRLAKQVGDNLGYPFPHDLQKEMTDYCRKIKMGMIA